MCLVIISEIVHMWMKLCDIAKTCNRAVLTVLLHDAQELDNNLGRWSDHDLSLSSLLGIVDSVQAIVLHEKLVFC